MLAKTGKPVLRAARRPEARPLHGPGRQAPRRTRRPLAQLGQRAGASQPEGPGKPEQPGKAEQPGKPEQPGKAARRGPRTARNARTGRGYRLAGVLAIVLVAGGAAAFAAVQYGSRPGARAAISSADLPAATRNSAAAWVASQVASTDVVACDPVMCQALEAHGTAAARVRELWPGTDNVAGAAVVVATPAVQGHLGTRLETAAPGVIARFGAGNRQIVIRAMAPQGAAVYRSDVAGDLAARKSSGAQLARQPSTSFSATEKKQLTAGHVDTRLMVVIAIAASKHPVQVVAFGDPSPGQPAAPLRSAELAYSGSAGKASVLAALNGMAASNPAYRAARITTVRLRTGHTALLIEFSAPSPLGLLGY